MLDPYPVPTSGPIHASIRPPGSKSLTNRALVCAALAQGTSRLTGVLDSEDTAVMIDAWRTLGLTIGGDAATGTLTVTGCGGRIPVREATLHLANSGTSIRFLTAAVATGQGRFVLDGIERMRQRPIEDLLVALRSLGVEAVSEHGTGCPPVIVTTDGLPGGTVTVAGAISSQYLSALMMAAPAAQGDVTIAVEGELVSLPYVAMTAAVMAAFGVAVEGTDAPGGRGPFVIRRRPAEGSDAGGLHRGGASGYQAADYAIEPDASAASYFWAAAAITGGSVTVEGLTRSALQGDVGFVDVLARMGCDVTESDRGLTVTGPTETTPDGTVRTGRLRGVDLDMAEISDTVQTLAAVALFADGPTRVRGVAHNRHKETDRIGDLATELRRLGATVDEHDDGLTITPGPLRAATVETYNDHRMAMSLALVGLRVPGVRIANPACTGKTYPGYWDDLARIVTRT